MTGNHRKNRAPDAGPKAIALGTTLALHAFVVAGVLWSTIHEAPAVVVEPPIMVDIVELPKFGVERDQKLLERIVQAPQPEANTAPVNLNQEREEEEKPPEEKKPELEEKQVEQHDPEAEKKKLDDEKKRRQKMIDQAMKQFADERADEDSPEGLENGYREGTSTRAAMLREESLWAAQVAKRIQEQLQRPAAISPGECRSLATLIPIRLTAEGKVSNEPSIEQSSGNQFFDDAAVRALRYFTDDGRGTLPLPNAEKLGPLRKMVQREGVAVRLECKP
jgi:outer membrane biosynthesis protein TonB